MNLYLNYKKDQILTKFSKVYQMMQVKKIKIYKRH